MVGVQPQLDRAHARRNGSVSAALAHKEIERDLSLAAHIPGDCDIHFYES